MAIVRPLQAEAKRRMEKDKPMAAFVREVGEQLRAAVVAGRGDEGDRMKRVDWLAFAIGRLGGPTRAAEKLGVSEQTVYTWLGKGLHKVQFSKMVALSKAAHVPLEYLGERMGPWDGPMERGAEDGRR